MPLKHKELSYASSFTCVEEMKNIQIYLINIYNYNKSNIKLRVLTLIIISRCILTILVQCLSRKPWEGHKVKALVFCC